MEDLVEGKWIKMEQLLTEYDSRLSSSLVALKQNTYEARDMMVKTVENTLSGSSVHVQSLRTKVHILIIQVESVEGILSTQRKELFSSLSEVEEYLGKKADKLTQAIYRLSRDLHVPNPLLED